MNDFFLLVGPLKMMYKKLKGIIDSLYALMHNVHHKQH